MWCVETDIKVTCKVDALRGGDDRVINLLDRRDISQSCLWGVLKQTAPRYGYCSAQNLTALDGNMGGQTFRSFV